MSDPVLNEFAVPAGSLTMVHLLRTLVSGRNRGSPDFGKHPDQLVDATPAE